MISKFAGTQVANKGTHYVLASTATQPQQHPSAPEILFGHCHESQPTGQGKVSSDCAMSGWMGLLCDASEFDPAELMCVNRAIVHAWSKVQRSAGALPHLVVQHRDTSSQPHVHLIAAKQRRPTLNKRRRRQ